MARDWASWLDSATAPASDTEEDERKRTEGEIRSAIEASGQFEFGQVRINAKGSYVNRTNVRRDADVDIAVEWQPSFKVHTWGDTDGMGPDELGYVRASPESVIEANDLRARVERAMLSAFPGRTDTSGQYAIKVSGDARRLPADVVPCFSLRRYDRVDQHHEGTRLIPANGIPLDNFPVQHYQNGVSKNEDTGGRYKKVVRCFKRLEADLLSRGLIDAEVPGYVVECLLWNVPNDKYNQSTIIADVAGCLSWLWDTLGDEGKTRELSEVCDLVYLYRNGRHSPADAQSFVGACLIEVFK